MLSFKSPEFFFVFAVFPLLFLLFKLKMLKKTEFSLTFSDCNGDIFRHSQKKTFFLLYSARFFEILSLFLCFFAAGNPILAKKEKISTSFSANLAFVLDCSPSMAAKDFDGISRFDAAKKAIFDIAEKNPNASFALVGFGDSAALCVPSTGDGNWFLSRLDERSAGEFGEGSAIGDGIARAVFHLQNCAKGEKGIIVLITDGECNAGSISPLTAAKLAREQGDFLVVVGVGSKGDVPIEFFDGNSGKAFSGLFRSEFDEHSLAEIAKEGSGNFFRADDGESLREFLAETIEKNSREPKFFLKTTEKPLFAPFLTAAACLLLAAFAVRLALGEAA